MTPTLALSNSHELLPCYNGFTKLEVRFYPKTQKSRACTFLRKATRLSFSDPWLSVSTLRWVWHRSVFI